MLPSSPTPSSIGRILGLLQRYGRGFLTPKITQCEHAAGSKTLKFLKLRCRYCFFVRRNGRWMVDCTKYGKHRIVQRDFNTDLHW